MSARTMLRRVGRGLAIVLALLVLLIGAAVLRYRPRSWPAAHAGRKGVASAVRLRADVQAFPPYRSPNHPQALAAMEQMVADRLRAFGWDVQVQLVQHGQNPFAYAHRTIAETATHNLIATRAPDASAPLTIFAAHIDAVSPSPGADDDGSGVAVLLELARILPPSSASHVELGFFNEEEDGLYGSYTFVTELGAAGRARIARAYVLDMVGAFDSRPHSQAYPPPLSWLAPDRGDFLAAIALPDADDGLTRLRAARDEVAPELSLVAFEPSRGIAERFPDIWRSDHAPFWDAKVPAIFLSDTGNFRSHTYHSAADRVETLDYERIAALTDALAATVEAR